MLEPKELVLFDLDGTLIDTVPDLADAIDSMQSELGLPLRGEAKVRTWVGNGIERLVKRALTDGDDSTEPAPDLYAHALSIFMDHYAARPYGRSKFYPGVTECLEHLQQAGYRLACVTNKRSRFTDLLLRAVGIHDLFELVISGDTLARRKPDPLPLLHASQHFDVGPERALMVGDSLNDVRAARAAGMQVLCVSYGYNCGRDIREDQPDLIVDSLAELIELLPAPQPA
jgi:phosphoglycolate phosphatase